MKGFLIHHCLLSISANFMIVLNDLGVFHTNQGAGRLVHRLTGLSPPVKYFTDRSKAVLLL